jgi:hypothetical protein
VIGQLNYYKEGLCGTYVKSLLSNDNGGTEGRNMPGGINEKVASQRAYESITLQWLVVVKGIGLFT